MQKQRALVEQLLEERARLEDLLSMAERTAGRINEAGSVRAFMHGKSAQFYYRETPDDKNGIYMPVSMKDRAVRIIQKEYCEDVARSAGEQIRNLTRFLDSYDPDAVEQVLLHMSRAKRTVVEPLEVTDDLFLAQWLAEEYEGLPFAEDMAEHYTLQGQRVRSKSEVMIADALFRSGIPYKYERPLYVGGREFHPDFTLLRMRDRKEIYWEHLGMMDDPEYLANALAKIKYYEANGIFPGDRLIITSETVRLPVNQLQIQAVIDHYLL